MKELTFFIVPNYSGVLTSEQYQELLDEEENGIDW